MLAVRVRSIVNTATDTRMADMEVMVVEDRSTSNKVSDQFGSIDKIANVIGYSSSL